MTKTLILIAALLSGTAAVAHDFTQGDLNIAHPHIPRLAANAPTAAGYLTITNTGTMPDRLTGIAAGFASMAMLHESKVDDSGVATMTHLSTLDIPAGATVTLEPGSLHIMFMGLTAPLADGAMLPATLTFEKAGTVAVEFMVEPAQGAAHDHSKMTEPTE